MDRIQNFFLKVRGKIAFYPTLISIAGIAIAFLLIYLEEKNISQHLMKISPALVINNTETARTLLSTLIGGLISLMVFSFSMVMVLLNQASSNFSPRVLPGIISDRKNQIVLGIYIAVILYNIFILVSIEPTDSSYQTPGFSVLLAIAFTVLCLACFIYFIHNISQSIQVGTILFAIYKKTKDSLLHRIADEKTSVKVFSILENGYGIKSRCTGYFQGILKDELLETCRQNDLRTMLTIKIGQFILEGDTCIKTEQSISEALQKELLDSLLFSQEEISGEHYTYGFRQITEIGVKAMSPGINDPGTAMSTLDYLTDLFTTLAKKSSLEFLKDENSVTWVCIQNPTFLELLHKVMATYRPYCKQDIMVSQKLIWLLKKLREKVKDTATISGIDHEMQILKVDIQQAITNEWDLKALKEGFSPWS